jgi:hypothetical protein
MHRPRCHLSPNVRRVEANVLVSTVLRTREETMCCLESTSSGRPLKGFYISGRYGPTIDRYDACAVFVRGVLLSWNATTRDRATVRLTKHLSATNQSATHHLNLCMTPEDAHKEVRSTEHARYSLLEFWSDRMTMWQVRDHRRRCRHLRVSRLYDQRREYVQYAAASS